MNSTHAANSSPENYEIILPVRVGFIIGVIGSLSIMVIVAGILVFGGEDIFAAARLIAAVVYGPDAVIGIVPIGIGTLVHLLTGGIFGAIFAYFMPAIPRGFLIVAGLVYAIMVWLVSTFIILPVVSPPMIVTDANKSILLLAHVVYGLVFGVGSGTYQLWWRLPSWLSPSDHL